MKLYEVPNLSYVRILPQEEEIENNKDEDVAKILEEDLNIEDKEIPVKTPPFSEEIVAGDLLFFNHLDGMYSLCQKIDPETLEYTNTCHIAGWTDVDIVELDELFNSKK